MLYTVCIYTYSSGDWLQRRPRLGQGCSAEEEEEDIHIHAVDLGNPN
jgi:hypothetical protein